LLVRISLLLALKVDRSSTQALGMIVLAIVDGELIVKRLYRRGTLMARIPETLIASPSSCMTTRIADLGSNHVLLQAVLLATLLPVLVSSNIS